MQLDLNLLTALDALLEEGSVAGAAARLHLSAPAMSRTLGRLRRATGDQILVRTGWTMTPTPHAVAIRGQVHELVQQAGAVLAPQQPLDLARLQRSFTLQCHDAIGTAIGPALLAIAQARAPGVTLRLLAEASADTNDLRHGQIDLEIGSAVPALPEIRHETIGHDRLVVAMRAGHPLAAGKLDAGRYARAGHLTVSRRGRLSDPVDKALAAIGQRRRVVASVPTSTAALLFVRQSDLVVAVPERMCGAAVAALGLATLPLPLKLAEVPVNHAWHQRYDTDNAHAWLRAMVREAMATVFAEDRSGRPGRPVARAARKTRSA
ncbi:LysR family transcriptional regulator [Cupriavidus sp. 30B13]|uniref:LysR family transcriptional regulator n=1 Tax=Cupriavidus sp. 30B13 TaxID=3384241 RepID=UPI003B91CF31